MIKRNALMLEIQSSRLHKSLTHSHLKSGTACDLKCFFSNSSAILFQLQLACKRQTNAQTHVSNTLVYNL